MPAVLGKATVALLVLAAVAVFAPPAAADLSRPSGLTAACVKGDRVVPQTSAKCKRGWASVVFVGNRGLSDAQPPRPSFAPEATRFKVHSVTLEVALQPTVFPQAARVHVSCPSGQVAVSGGWRKLAQGLMVETSYNPNAGDTWMFQVRPTTSKATVYTKTEFYAVCAQPVLT